MAKKKTVATKRIGRKIQTKQFESLDVSIECTDEFEWETIQEREEKLEKLTQLAIRDYDETFDQVCKALKLTEKRAFVHGSKQDLEAKPQPQPQTSKKEDDDLEDMLGDSGE